MNVLPRIEFSLISTRSLTFSPSPSLFLSLSHRENQLYVLNKFL